MSDRSAFPTTHATWLETMVEDSAAPHTDTRDSRRHGAHDPQGLSDTPSANAGIRAERAAKARAHVMERYAAPLEIFVKGSSLARLGEPAEIVNGFFAARLSDARYLRAWPSSGMRFRRWLMNGILFYGQGLARDRARAAARGSTVAADLLDLRIGTGTAAEEDFDRAWALAIVREATARVEAALVSEGRAVEFDIFRRHAIEGLPYAVFARDVGRSAQQCAGATRLVAQRVRGAIADLLREEGVPDREIDDEIARVRGVL